MTEEKKIYTFLENETLYYELTLEEFILFLKQSLPENELNKYNLEDIQFFSAVKCNTENLELRKSKTQTQNKGSNLMVILFLAIIIPLAFLALTCFIMGIFSFIDFLGKYI